MEDLIKKFNLPSYIKGKSFSEASKLIQNKFKDREDNVSKNTMIEMLSRLKDAQEYTKQLEEKNSNQFFKGGDMKQMNEFDLSGALSVGKGALQMGTNLFGNPNIDMSGNTQYEEGSGVTDALGGAMSGAQAGMALGPVGAAVGGVLGGISSLIGGNKKRDKIREAQTNKAHNTFNSSMNQFSLGGNIDPDYPVNPNDLINSFKTNKEALNYVNPYPERSNRWNTFDAYQRKLKNSSFGQSDTSPIKPRTYKDINGFIGSKLEDEIKYEEKLKSRPTEDISNIGLVKEIQNNVSNNFAKGGNMYFNGGPVKPIATTLGLEMVGKDILMGSTPELKFDTSNIDSLDTTKKLPKADLSGLKNFLKDNGGDILRYSPVVANAAQLLSMKKPEKETLAKLDNRYKPNYIDEQSMLNSINNSFNDNFVTESSGGNVGAVRANARAAQLNKMRAISDAYKNTAEYNRGEDRTAQQFNANIDQFNVSTKHREDENYARDLGAYNTNKSNLVSQLGNDLGDIGTELNRDSMIKELFDYTRKGKYQNKKAKGGYLDDVFEFISKDYKNRFKK